MSNERQKLPDNLPVVTPEKAESIIKCRDAFIKGDMEDVWHFLYKFADPTFKKLKPWQELEEIAKLKQ